MTDATSPYPAQLVALQTIAQIAEQTSEADVVGLLVQASRQLGATAALFTTFLRNDSAHDSYRFLVACKPTWCSNYQRNRWFVNDPALIYATTRSEPRRLSQLPLSTQGQRDLMASASANGFRSGAAMPAPSANGMVRVGVLTLGSEDPYYFEGDGFELARLSGRLLAMELHDWWIRKARSDLLTESNITADDLDLLKMERQGLRTKEIALLTSSSTASVNSRFQRLNLKLGVPTRAAAARRALEHGLL